MAINPSTRGARTLVQSFTQTNAHLGVHCLYCSSHAVACAIGANGQRLGRGCDARGYRRRYSSPGGGADCSGAYSVGYGDKIQSKTRVPACQRWFSSLAPVVNLPVWFHSAIYYPSIARTLPG